MRKILFIGDVVGRPGRTFVIEQVGRLKEKHGIDIVIANGENAAGGAGITGKIARELLAAGIDGITLGDHAWDQKTLAAEIGQVPGLCRPANMPELCPGPSFLIVEKKGFRFGLFTVLGRVFMPPRDSPFAAAERLVAQLKEKTDAVLVEIHAEATSEKIAFGRHLDGQVAAVVGTHTHVPTADAAVLPRGTAYITDVGMSGPYDSVLGREVEPVIGNFRDGMPRRFEVAAGDVRLSAVLIEVDEGTGLARRIELLTVRATAADANTGVAT